MISHIAQKIVLFITIIMVLNLNADEHKLEQVKLQLQWKHQFEFAGFYAAKEKGYYKEVGLDVDFIEFKDGMNLVEEVLSNRADFALGYSSIIADYLNAKPIVFVANFFKQSPLVLVTQKEITSLYKLKNSKIEGLSNNIDNITLSTMLSKFGIKSKNIQTVSPTFNIQNFIDKKIEAMSVFTTNELFLLKEAGVKYNVYDPVSYGAKYYDENLFTSREKVIKRPKQVDDFREASIKGWKYALSHKDEIANLIIKKYNTQHKSKKALLFEARQIDSIMLPNVYKIGSIDIDRVRIIADAFLQAGFVKNLDKNLENFVLHSDNKLTKEDLDYLKEKKLLKACVNPDWMPYSGIKDNWHVGIDADFMQIFEEKIGIPIKVYITDDFDESMESIKSNKCDIMSMLLETKQRKKYLKFTEPYFNFLTVLITNIDEKINTDLENKKIAVIKNYVEIGMIKEQYPGIEIIEVNSIKEGLNKLRNNEIYGFIENAFVINYYFKKDDYLNFKISNYFKEKSFLRIGVKEGDKQLYEILNKVIRSISTQKKQYIRKKWFNLSVKKDFNYEQFFNVFIGIFILLIFILQRHYVVKKINKKLNQKVQEELAKSKDKDKMIFHQSKLVAMGEMIENIAHQWRQPLSQINSCVLVIDDTLNEKNIKNNVVEEKLLEIEFLTKYMSNTINDFKNFLDKDKVKTNFVLADIINKSIKVLGTKINKHNVKIFKNFKKEYKYTGYANELQQVFIVIINNALDVFEISHIQNPTITFEVKIIKEHYVISISDNAGGIKEDDIERIFEPYYTTKYKSHGTGIGLYISKLIIEDSLNGKLSVKNTLDGSCFTINLGI